MPIISSSNLKAHSLCSRTTPTFDLQKRPTSSLRRFLPFPFLGAPKENGKGADPRPHSHAAGLSRGRGALPSRERNQIQLFILYLSLPISIRFSCPRATSSASPPSNSVVFLIAFPQQRQPFSVHTQKGCNLVRIEAITVLLAFSWDFESHCLASTTRAYKI
ncbi:hypothetical protein KFK09_020277 [Dendrobium nobile]|uniref:Uncharacterized protein n=1 Tax=Dendrobium nobile TaxID=94219 RepID=A0A8T3ATJ6_DENNO|nr:hypothetical protein KFK09_020277 [Dendrobium nobile]